MSTQILKDKFEKITEDFKSKEIEKALEKVFEEKPADVVKVFLSEVDFGGKILIHPIIKKAVLPLWARIPYMIRKINEYRRMSEKINNLSNKKVEVKDIDEMKELLKSLKSKCIEYIVERIGDVKEGLRHLHAPGSVAQSEGRNLYFEKESFTQKTLYSLASRLFDSISLGNDIGIYSEYEKLMETLKQLAVLEFGSPFIIQPEKLKIIRGEEDRPYISFLKFILWLKKESEEEEDEERGKLLLSILERLKTAPIIIFFVPEERERWCTITLPRIDYFMNKWIENKNLRECLEKFLDDIREFLLRIYEKAERRKERAKAENSIKILINNYDFLCRNLIEYGVPNFCAIRNMMNVIIDLSFTYDVKVSFSSLKVILSS